MKYLLAVLLIFVTGCNVDLVGPSTPAERLQAQDRHYNTQCAIVSKGTGHVVKEVTSDTLRFRCYFSDSMVVIAKFPINSTSYGTRSRPRY